MFVLMMFLTLSKMGYVRVKKYFTRSILEDFVYALGATFWPNLLETWSEYLFRCIMKLIEN